jgi:hypothetical protein
LARHADLNTLCTPVVITQNNGPIDAAYLSWTNTGTN